MTRKGLLDFFVVEWKDSFSQVIPNFEHNILNWKFWLWIYFHFYHLQSKVRTVNQHFYNSLTWKYQKKLMDSKDGFEAALFNVSVWKKNYSFTEPLMGVTPEMEHIIQASFTRWYRDWCSGALSIIFSSVISYTPFSDRYSINGHGNNKQVCCTAFWFFNHWSQELTDF